MAHHDAQADNAKVNDQNSKNVQGGDLAQLMQPQILEFMKHTMAF